MLRLSPFSQESPFKLARWSLRACLLCHDLSFNLQDGAQRWGCRAEGMAHVWCCPSLSCAWDRQWFQHISLAALCFPFWGSINKWGGKLLSSLPLIIASPFILCSFRVVLIICRLDNLSLHHYVHELFSQSFLLSSVSSSILWAPVLSCAPSMTFSAVCISPVAPSMWILILL